jgi:hypothetical protein
MATALSRSAVGAESVLPTGSILSPVAPRRCLFSLAASSAPARAHTHART